MCPVDAYGDNLQSCVRCCSVGILRNLRNNIILDLLYSAFNLRHNTRCHLSFILMLVRSLAVTCFQPIHPVHEKEIYSERFRNVEDNRNDPEGGYILPSVTVGNSRNILL
jgi:hypothetical protein